MYFTTLCGRPQFGAHLKHLRTALAHADSRDSAAGGARTFDIDTHDLLLALGGGGGGVWPRLEGAHQVAALYDAMRTNLPQRRRCLRPPPKQEAELEALMCRGWAPLTDAGVQQWAKAEEGDGWVHSLADVRIEGVFLSLPRGCAPLEGAAALEAFAREEWVVSPPLTLRALPFMGSCVLNAFTPPSSRPPAHHKHQ
jgi:hypothetical protein